MNFPEAIEKLAGAATPKTKRALIKKGVTLDLYGVSTQDLKKIAEEAKINHTLALRLWKTGNHDARMLATMIRDKRRITPGEIEFWSMDLDNQVLTDSFVKNCVMGTPFAKSRIAKWANSENIWQKRASKMLKKLIS